MNKSGKKIIIKVNIRQKLDIYLFKYQKKESITDDFFIHFLNDRYATIVSKIDIRHIKEHLEKDGYIRLNRGTNEYEITIKGELFKGYVKQNRNNSISTALQFSATLAIVLGTLAAGLYGLWQMLLYYHQCK